MLFLSPVFYPVASMPASLRAGAWINPLALVIEELRAIIFLGRTPQWLPLTAAAAVSLLIAAAGLHWFEKTRRGFADVV
jgi:lipopolysaccharide transport system permease protein